MAYNALNNLIDAYIYANGVQAITGQILNGVLKQMVSQLGSGYHLMGVAGPETVPASNDYAMAYFAATAGEYADFGGITLAAGEVAVLLTSGNGSWSKQTIYTVPTDTADLENTAGFITNAVTDLVNYYTKTEVDDTLANYPTLSALATALADYYTKTEIDGQMGDVDTALADRYTKSETDTKLGDYYKKTETYDKEEVDSIVAALSRQEYIVAWDGLAAPDVSAIPAGVTVTYSGTTYTGTMAASASTVNKIYMVWNGVAYDMYGTSQDGGYSWVPMGTTSVDLSQYATKAELSQLQQEVTADVSQLEAKVDVNKVMNYTSVGKLYVLADLPNVGRLKKDGTIDAIYVYHRCSDIISLDALGEIYYYRAESEDATYTGIIIYDGDMTILTTIGWTSGATKLDLTSYPTAKYFRVCASSSAFKLYVNVSNEIARRLTTYLLHTREDGKYIESGNGNMQSFASYCVYGVKVKEGISVTFAQYYSGATIGYCFKDKNGNYISGSALVGNMGDDITVITPARASVLYISVNKSYEMLTNVRIDISTLVNSPDDFSITNTKIDNNAVSEEKVNYLQIAANKNLISGIEEGYINGDGEEAGNLNLYRTTRVPMSHDKSYYLRYFYEAGFYAYYDKAGNVIAAYGASEGDISTQPVTPPAGTCYGRFTIPSLDYTKRAYICEVDRKCAPYNYEFTGNESLIGGMFCNYNGREASVFDKGIAIGDSLTQGVFNHNEGGGADESAIIPKYSWPTIFSKLSGVEMTNMGVGGATSKEWWEMRGDRDFSGHDFAVIAFGVNDVSRYGGWTADVTTAYTNIINKLKTQNKGIKIFVATPFPGIQYSSIALTVTYSESLKSFVEGLNDADVMVFDLQKYAHTRDFEEYNAGHLTAIGYSALASDIYALLSYTIKTNKDKFKFVQFINTDYSWTPSS